MQLIDTPNNQFHDGDPTTGTLGTALKAFWFNVIQSEVSAPILAAGLSLDPNNNGQLLQAISILANNPRTGIATVQVAGAASAALTAAQAAMGIINLTGTLTGSIVVTFPSQVGRWLVLNNTQGGFAVTLKAAAGASLQLQPGFSLPVFCDGNSLGSERTDYGQMQVPTAPQFDNSGAPANTTYVKRAQGSLSGTLVTSNNNLVLDISYAGGYINYVGGQDGTITLPSVVGADGSSFYFWNGSGFNLTLAASVGKFYGPGVPGAVGVTSLTLPNGTWAIVRSDGRNPVVLESSFAPTLAAGDNSTRTANTAFTQSAITSALTAYPTTTAVNAAIQAAVQGVSTAIGSRAGVTVYTKATGQPLTDVGKLVEAAGTFVLTVPNFASSFAGASCTYQNTGTGQITLTAPGNLSFFWNGSQTQTVPLQAGTGAEIVWDGTSIVVLGIASASPGPIGVRRGIDGIIEMWGMTSAVAQGLAINITLPAQFPTACWNVIATPSTGVCQPGASAGGNVISQSQIQLFNNSTTAQSFGIYWRALGK
ncbi:gp53-like domain-containing protein [Chromobacterium vaccinii]|uniref:gp53-like domain-containing protein n=1 Tax=Chromobacterium vaccinii TaxID=1108595 RepID=UPI003C765AFD